MVAAAATGLEPHMKDDGDGAGDCAGDGAGDGAGDCAGDGDDDHAGDGDLASDGAGNVTVVLLAIRAA